MWSQEAEERGWGEIEKEGKPMQKFITKVTAVSNWGSGASGSLMQKSTDCLPEGPTWKMAERFIRRSSLMSWNLVPEALTLAKSCCSWRAPGQDEEKPRLRAQSGISDPPTPSDMHSVEPVSLLKLKSVRSEWLHWGHQRASYTNLRLSHRICYSFDPQKW